MSLRFGDVRQWNADLVEESASMVRKRAADLERLLDDLKLIRPLSWTGQTAEVAALARERQAQAYEDTAQAGEAFTRELFTASDGIVELKTAIADAEGLAARYDIRIGDDGSLSWQSNPDLLPEEQDALRQARTQLSTVDIPAIMARAELIDAALAADIARAQQPLVRLDAKGNQVDRLQPPAGASPEEINAWWDGLSDDERAELIATNPALVGPTDGIPAEFRDQANRVLLKDKRRWLESERVRLEGLIAPLRGPGSTAARMKLQGELAAVNGKLSGIDAIKKRLTKGDAASDDSDRYYLMQIQHSVDGQAIVARGNPDTADNVVTYIPGTGSGLSTIEGDLERSDLMQGAAKASEPSESTSVITYMGYNAPAGLTNATQQSYAHEAKLDLDRFQDGLRATHEGAPSHNTVLGHSYGSVVAAVGAHETGLAVDNVVMVASPGGVYDHASELGVDNVYATIADQDPVDNQPFHGPDTDSRDYGADVFESSPSKSRSPDILNTAAHSEYWDDGNKALRNMGHIIAGNPDLVTRP